MTTKDFITKLMQGDKELAGKLEKCKAPEEAYKIAKAAGLTDGMDAFVAEMKKLNEAVKDLSEDDLADVAGGLGEENAWMELSKKTTLVTDLHPVTQPWWLGPSAAASV
jgi:hypothetical protein